MLKFIKTPEVHDIMTIMLQNLIDGLTPENNPILAKYDHAYLTPEIEREINSKYQELGINYKVKHDTSEVYNLPYNKKINLKDVMSEHKNIEITDICIKKNIIHEFDYVHTNDYLKKIHYIVAYNKNIYLPMITEDSAGWMTPVMMEYNTMKYSIEKSHGHVLTFGLGIGFYQFMCLEKENVKKVTIIEKNPHIIKLFKELILPHFNRPNDIEIIEGDCFDYFNDNYLGKYDYVFVDIWRNNEDGFPIYEQLVKAVNNLNDIDFWIENTFIDDVRTYIFMYLYHVHQGSLDKVLNTPDGTDLFKYMYTIDKYFKKHDKTIQNETDVLLFINNKEFIYQLIKLKK